MIGFNKVFHVVNPSFTLRRRTKKTLTMDGCMAILIKPRIIEVNIYPQNMSGEIDIFLLRKEIIDN